MRTTALILIVLISSVSLWSQNPEICKKDIYKHISILASDSLEGRKPGTPGDIKATNYIIESFKNYNLKLYNKTGKQEFEVVTDVILGKSNRIKFDNYNAKVKKDFIPFSFSASKMFEAEAVFCGYGFNIKEDTLEWNDYKGIETEGKWLIILRGDPEMDKKNSAFIPYSDERTKISIAKDKNPGGIIFVSGKEFSSEDKLIKLDYRRGAGKEDIPVINITRELANKILKEKTIEELEKELIKTYKPQSFNTGTEINGQASVIHKKSTTNNIVAILEGNDPKLKDQYIVIGAHYDHLGYGGEGSGSRMPDTTAIHYGADDNASGVAAIMELAEKISAEKSNKRTLIFVAFGGEEMGLLGSKHFIKNLDIVDGEHIYAMINFDMLGRLKENKNISIGGTGTAKEFDSIIDKYTKKSDLEITKNPDGYGPSDHSTFYSQNIPVLFFTTGVHTDYHTPDDNINNINAAGEETVLDFIYKIVNELATRTEKLKLQHIKSERKRKYGRSLKITLGLIPDVAAGDVDGLKVIGVKQDRPAQKSGMKAGDIITSINGKNISNIYDYMHRLQDLKEGTIATVEVNRKGKKKVLLVKL